jgi:hypothetical protein
MTWAKSGVWLRRAGRLAKMAGELADGPGLESDAGALTEERSRVWVWLAACTHLVIGNRFAHGITGDGSVMVAGNAHPPLDGGTVLITGASAGIGREFAMQLAPRARVLILLARRAGRLDELRTSLLARYPQLQVLTLPVDLSDEDDVGRALAKTGEQAGAVDVLVNNAGVGDQVLADQADWTRVRTVLRTNVLAVAQLTTALVPAMVKRGRGGSTEYGLGGRADGHARSGGVFSQQAFYGRLQRGAAG